jgi:amino-acid N-acetyltransferase
MESMDHQPQKALGFVNLEDEYGTLRQTLMTAQDCEDQVEALDTAREALFLMPSYSSGILMAPSAAPSLISNFVTEKPLSSTPPGSVASLDSSQPTIHPPTLLRKGLSVKEFTNLGDLNQDRLWGLLEASFSKSLMTDSYDARLERSLDRIILTGDYQGAAIITREGPHHLPYLDKFSVAPSAQGMGVADILWTRIRNLYPDLFWRSRTDNPVNKWYFDRSDGNARLEGGHWMLFWYGSRGLYELEKYIPVALKIPPSFESAPVKKKKCGGDVVEKK